MAEQLFDIFGDIVTKQVHINVSRQQLFNNENIGKVGLSGPVKPNEPIKKAGEMKKSFLSNTGLAMQTTPAPKKTFSPMSSLIRSQKTSQNIYSDADFTEEVEFSRPHKQYDNYNMDLIDYLFPSSSLFVRSESPRTPPPCIPNMMSELHNSFDEEFFLDNDYADESVPFQDDDLPDIF